MRYEKDKENENPYQNAVDHVSDSWNTAWNGYNFNLPKYGKNH